jgi:two-component system sensor histidine kinase BaeS
MLLAMLAVAVLAAAATGFLVRRQTIDAVRDAARVDLDTEAQVFDTLLNQVWMFNDWEEVAPMVLELAELFDMRIALTEFDGTLIVDSEPDAALPQDPRRIIDPANDGFLGGGVLAEEAFADFDTQQGQAFDFCVEEFDIESLPAETLELFEEELESEAFDDESVALEVCEHKAFEIEQPALLYIGYDVEELVDLGSLDRGTSLLALAGIVGLAALLAFVVAGRVSGPVRRLTGAAAALEDGDLSQRVEVRGSGEVARLGEAFNSMAVGLETSQAARSRMVSDVAHELRNPVGVLQGNLEAAQDEVFPIDRELVDTLHDETMHLRRLVDDLQQLALADAGALMIAPELTDLAELVTQVTTGHRGVAAEADVSLRLRTVPAQAHVDPTRVRQVVTNLVTNALAYTPSGGEVVVSLEAAEHHVDIVVSDTGVGLSPEQQVSVFDRFWRADESRNRHTGGAGVGLSICKEIAEAHGGTVTVTSEPNKGSTFRVHLPKTQP